MPLQTTVADAKRKERLEKTKTAVRKRAALDFEMIRQVRMMTADDERRDLLLKHYERLIKALAARMIWAAEFDDLFQAGYCGLLRAVQSYAPGKAVFATHACNCIKSEMQKVAGKQFAPLDFINEEGAEECLLDSYAPSASDALLPVLPSQEDNALEVWLENESNQQLRRAVVSLHPKYRNIIVLRYVDGLSHEEIGKKLGNVTKQAIQQQEAKALAVLRKRLKMEGY